jgi:hypothetical protein
MIWTSSRQVDELALDRRGPERLQRRSPVFTMAPRPSRRGDEPTRFSGTNSASDVTARSRTAGRPLVLQCEPRERLDGALWLSARGQGPAATADTVSNTRAKYKRTTLDFALVSVSLRRADCRLVRSRSQVCGEFLNRPCGRAPMETTLTEHIRIAATNRSVRGTIRALSHRFRSGPTASNVGGLTRMLVDGYHPTRIACASRTDTA